MDGWMDGLTNRQKLLKLQNKFKKLKKKPDGSHYTIYT
jgi:hypothetical protein